NPPLPPTHPYHPHIINDNPPVRSRIMRQGGSWTAANSRMTTDASASAFIMSLIMEPPLANLVATPLVEVDRHAHGGVLDGLLNHSPHQPPNGCTAVMASDHRRDGMDPPSELRDLLLTSFGMLFVAYVALDSSADTNTVSVIVFTTEPPVGGASDAFKDRRRTTAPLVRGLLGNAIADMALNRGEVEEDDEEDGADDGGDDNSDSDEDMDSNGDSDGQQEQPEEDDEDEGVEEGEAKRRRTTE
ncbi:unnamed protein product, partial [Vitrella brassicaformis CCMP3155]